MIHSANVSETKQAVPVFLVYRGHDSATTEHEAPQKPSFVVKVVLLRREICLSTSMIFFTD